MQINSLDSPGNVFALLSTNIKCCSEKPYISIESVNLHLLQKHIVTEKLCLHRACDAYSIVH